MAEGSRKKVMIALATIAFAIAGWLIVRTVVSGAPRDSVEYLSEDITIRCDETGEEWTMNRGRLERDLYTRSGVLDPSIGIPNPTTGKTTGFPVDRELEWDRVIARINAEKASLVQSRGE